MPDDQKLREWARDWANTQSRGRAHQTIEEFLYEAGASLVRRCAEIVGVCECGDWCHQHENLTGKCRVCGNSRAPYDGCQKYRKSKVKTDGDAILREYGLSEEGK